MSEPMDEGTKTIIGMAVTAGALGGLVLYNYPQKYWIPWLFILVGSAGTSAIGGWYFFAD
jgi:hypothetical protein